MDERTEDPREYRGGVREPEDAKGDWADNEGVVPREMIDDVSSEDPDPQALDSDVTGEVTGQGRDEDTIERTAGDDADATNRDESTDAESWHTDPNTVTGRTGQGES